MTVPAEGRVPFKSNVRRRRLAQCGHANHAGERLVIVPKPPPTIRRHAVAPPGRAGAAGQGAGQAI
jgi:hypothetical protein